MKKLLCLTVIICLLALSACQGKGQDTDKGSSSSNTTVSDSGNKSDNTSASADAGKDSAPAADTSTPTEEPTPTPTEAPTPTPTPEPTEPPKSYESVEDYYGDYVAENGGSMTFYFDSEYNNCYRIGNIIFNADIDLTSKYDFFGRSAAYLQNFDAMFGEEKVTQKNGGFEVEFANIAGVEFNYMFGVLTYNVYFNADGTVTVELCDIGSGRIAEATYTRVE